MTQRAIDGEYIYFVTANVKNRRWYFVYPDRAVKLGQAIQTCCEMKRFELLAYCILPNHMHVLVKKGVNRTLESVRCREKKPPRSYLFQHRRLSSSPHRRLSSRREKGDELFTLSQLMQSIKGAFSRTLPPGPFWQHRSYVRAVEDENYLANLIEYIRFNYTKMDLPEMYGKPPFVFIDDRAISTAA